MLFAVGPLHSDDFRSAEWLTPIWEAETHRDIRVTMHFSLFFLHACAFAMKIFRIATQAWRLQSKGKRVRSRGTYAESKKAMLAAVDAKSQIQSRIHRWDISKTR